MPSSITMHYVDSKALISSVNLNLLIQGLMASKGRDLKIKLRSVKIKITSKYSISIKRLMLRDNEVNWLY